jgi:hypothetical protein
VFSASPSVRQWLDCLSQGALLVVLKVGDQQVLASLPS